MRPVPAAFGALTAVIASLSTGCIYAPLDLGLGDLGKMQEVTLAEARTDNKIVLVRIDGEITDTEDSGGLFGGSEGTTAKVKDVLDLASKDDNVRAILLRVNSPGGGVTASDIIYHEILDWKRENRKPVVAIMMDVAASGGYYVSLAADRIIIHPTCITGSIGVVAMLPNVSELGKKIGVSVFAIKSGANKDLGNPFTPLEPEARKIFQSLVDQMYDRFLKVVMAGRHDAFTPEALRKIADGRVYTASEAKALKLVDEIGYFDQAIAETKKLAGIEEARIVAFERKGLGAGRRTIYSREHIDPIEASVLGRGGEGDRNLIKLDARPLLPGPQPVLRYLWLPSVH